MKDIIFVLMKDILPSGKMDHISDMILSTSLDKNLHYLLNSDISKQLKETMEKSSVSDIKKIIETDELLSSRIIKSSNSPLYPRVRPVKNLEEAIITIGTKSINKLLYSEGLSKILRLNKNLTIFKRIIFNSIFSAYFFQHSYEKSGLKKFISDDKYLSGYWGSSGQDYYLLGLMHNIGKIVLVYIYRDTLKTDSNSSSLEFLRHPPEEEEYFGVTHDVFSMLLSANFDFQETYILLSGLHDYLWEPNRTGEPYNIGLSKIASLCIMEKGENNSSFLLSYFLFSLVLTITDSMSYEFFQYLHTEDSELVNQLFFKSKDESDTEDILTEIIKISNIITSSLSKKTWSDYTNQYIQNAKHIDSTMLKQIQEWIDAEAFFQTKAFSTDIINKVLKDIFFNLRA